MGPSDADTLNALSSDGGARAPARSAPRLPCLTILYHPDPARVGERALVVRAASGRPVRLSRNELSFAHPAHGAEARPLADPYVSRAALELSAEDDGGLTIAVPARAAAQLDDAPLDGQRARLSADRLAAGAVLELAKRVVLWVHAAELGTRPPDYGLVGESGPLREVCRTIARVADLDLPVLIRGETGVGKERVAQAIHAASGAPGPCVAVNVATLAPSLAASELFGHAKGAFTGASERHVGLFERADRGTLFLDEIGELADDVQPMLLRALETGRIRPLGDREERAVAVRVVSATDADLEAAVERGRFRAALYHRLRGFELTVPPLRDRREDVGRLTVAFLREELAKTGELARWARTDPDAPPWIDRRLLARFARHRWPGNVRQLRGAARQLVVASRGEETLRADEAIERMLAAEGPPIAAREPDARGPAASGPSREAIADALRAHGWSIAKAARALGLTRSALYRRVEGDPELRTSSELDPAELERGLREHGGDVDALAAALRVSPRALKLRLRALGLAR